MIETTIIAIDFYSEVLQDDVVLNLQVRYEKVEVGNIDSCEKFGTKTTESSSFEAQFLLNDVTILNDRFNYNIAKEFYKAFDDYADEIQEEIENEIN